MKFFPMKLVTIIVEPVLREKLLKELRDLGAKGATDSDVRGEGTSQRHSSAVPGEKIKIECIVSEELADKIVSHLSTKYFSNYSVIVYVGDVSVLRSQKF